MELYVECQQPPPPVTLKGWFVYEAIGFTHAPCTGLLTYVGVYMDIFFFVWSCVCAVVVHLLYVWVGTLQSASAAPLPGYSA